MASRTEEECQRQWKKSDEFISDAQVQNRLSDCSSYFSKINISAHNPILPNETEIAFGIVTHSQIGLLESLLASIFRPHHSYCIFVDAKSTSKFKALTKALISCYKLHYPKVIQFIIMEVHYFTFIVVLRNNKCSQNAVKMQSKCSQNAAKIQSKCSQNTAKMQSKCSQNAVKMQSKYSQNFVKCGQN